MGWENSVWFCRWWIKTCGHLFGLVDPLQGVSHGAMPKVPLKAGATLREDLCRTAQAVFP
jgi:hypothetical protein